jgi:hypothetical protein
VIGAPVLEAARVPDRLVGAVLRGPVVEASPDAILFRVPTVARFLVQAEGPVLVERAVGASDADLACFRDGPVAAAAALLRGHVVLRAATVSIGGTAVALCGVSAAGKSSLAAALGQRGHTVLADAVTAISTDPDRRRFVVAPLGPELQLWPDSVRELGLDETPSRVVRAALAARAYRLGPDPVAAPLGAVGLLSIAATAKRARLEAVDGAAKVRALLGAGWHLRLADPLGLSTALFSRVADLASAVPCVRVVRPRRGVSAAQLAKIVEGLVA